MKYPTHILLGFSPEFPIAIGVLKYNPVFKRYQPYIQIYENGNINFILTEKVKNANPSYQGVSITYEDWMNDNHRVPCAEYYDEETFKKEVGSKL